MGDGEGFARRVTLENLDEFREFLDSTSSPSQEEDAATEEENDDGSENGEERAGNTRTQKGRETFPGESFPVSLPFAPASLPNRKEGAGTEPGSDDAGLDSNLEVLVATLPRSGPRWGQANFTLEIYEDYFGAKAGTKREVTLRHVRSDGTLEEVETRESVESESENYRFELGAASGPPPEEDNPLSVFLRLPNGLFLYRLLAPTDNGYDDAQEILDEHWDGPARQVPRVLIDVSELRRMWPDCPLLEVAD